jgi:hypothetical protein
MSSGAKEFALLFGVLRESELVPASLRNAGPTILAQQLANDGSGCVQFGAFMAWLVSLGTATSPPEPELGVPGEDEAAMLALLQQRRQAQQEAAESEPSLGVSAADQAAMVRVLGPHYGGATGQGPRSDGGGGGGSGGVRDGVLWRVFDAPAGLGPSGGAELTVVSPMSLRCLNGRKGVGWGGLVGGAGRC